MIQKANKMKNAPQPARAWQPRGRFNGGDSVGAMLRRAKTMKTATTLLSVI
jgi:hypothetical protein